MAASKQDFSVISFKATPVLREWLQQEATKGYRSMSAQIVLLLDTAKIQKTEEKNHESTV